MKRLILAIVLLALSFPALPAQLNEDIVLQQSKRILRASNSALSVPASGNTTLLDLDVKDTERIYVQLVPTTQALDAFIVAILPHSNGAYSTIASAATDFTAPVGLMVGASGDLTTLAAAATGWFILDTRGLARVRIQASANVAGAATVTIYAGGY